MGMVKLFVHTINERSRHIATEEERIARILRRLTLVAKDIAALEGDNPGTRLLIRYAGEAVSKAVELVEMVRERTQKVK